VRPLAADPTGGGRDPVVELAVLHLRYQALRADALAAGRLVPDGAGRLAPAAGTATADLLDERLAVAATALRPRLHHGADVRVTLPREFLLADEPLDLAIDLADGAGLRRLRPGEPLRVRYATTGRKPARLRLTAADGTVHWARFDLDVVALATPPPSEVWPLTATIGHEGDVASGEAYILLAPGHAVVTDPVVVVEGFDLDDSLNWPELYALLNQENLLEDLRALGRDAVVLNFTSATDPIPRNGYLLVSLLQTLEGLLPADRTYPLVGASMGGLVSRFALSWLETAGTGHRCDLFIAFDTPHAGAMIPLGLQLWVDFFAPEADEAAFLLGRLNTPAAREMLLYHHTALAGQTAAPDPRRAAFAAELAAVGGWPQQPRLVAIANGSGAGVDQGFAPGAQLVDYEYGSFLVDITGNVWAVPDGAQQVVFDGEIDLLWPLPDRSRRVEVAGTLPWDGAPGGFRASLAQLDTTEVPYGDLTALYDNHAFIPTVSSVALGDGDPFADIAAAGTPAPLDAVYVPAENQEHVAITPQTRQWVLDEILGGATAVDGDAPLAAVTLHGAAPNPFNPRTEVTFSLPAASAARLWIADVRGRRVRDLLDDRLEAGRHAAVWDGRDDAGREVAAGVYLAVVEHAGARVAARLALVR
jgi:hypothetical protein